MPTTCRDIIRSALKKLGVVGAGREPSDDQAADGLASLQSLYVELIIGGGFGSQRDVLVSANYTACPGDRITLQTAGLVVTLPTLADLPPDAYGPPGFDGGYVYDYGFVSVQPQLSDMSLVTVNSLIDAAVFDQLVYDASLARWISIPNLSLSDPAPLATRGPDGLASMLAARIAPDYGQGAELAPSTAKAAVSFQMSVCSHYGNSTSVRAEFF